MGCRKMENVMSVFNAYHGVSAADHQARFNDLLSKGYRIISLSVYGDPSNASYAAVWVQRAGAAWQAFHGPGRGPRGIRHAHEAGDAIQRRSGGVIDAGQEREDRALPWLHVGRTRLLRDHPARHPLSPGDRQQGFHERRDL